MQFLQTDIVGVYRIEPTIFSDTRGFFLRAYCQEEMQAANITTSFVQGNLAGSRHRGTLRGLHFQTAPAREAKLVRCVRGAVFDVAVDIRPDSPTFGCWYGTILSGENKHMLYIPEGCAHGYLTLEDDSDVFYLVSAKYTPEAEQGIRWNDPFFKIDWPLTDNLILSDKDRQWPDFTPDLFPEDIP